MNYFDFNDKEQVFKNVNYNLEFKTNGLGVYSLFHKKHVIVPSGNQNTY